MFASRGHVQPHFSNLPRRRPRMRCQQNNPQPSAPAIYGPTLTRLRVHVRNPRVQSRPPGFQEVFLGSRVWISHNLSIQEDDDDDETADGSVEEDKINRKWMWDDKLGFSGVIRVRVCEAPREFTRSHVARREGTSREELELVIRKEQTLLCDDIGISALSDSQLDEAAAFLDQCRRQADNTGKVLIIPPPNKPAEALSIALFALSLPSTRSLSSSSTSSYLSQLSFLPGILELVQENRGFALIQLALWHLHDLPSGGNFSEYNGLGSEWRGALSFDGIQRLECLSATRGTNSSSEVHSDLYARLT